MKKKSKVTINPDLDRKYESLKVGIEQEKKHKDLVSLVERMNLKQSVVS